MISIKLNGVLEGYFQCRNGLRQGDPLSPFLFVLGMEVLSAFLRSKLHDSLFSFHWRTRQMKLTHVIFADDIFLFSKGESNSICLLLDNVIRFTEFSGLSLNKKKCLGFYCGVPDSIIDATSQRYGFSRGTMPISYLGLPLITGRLNKQLCSPLISRLCQKIELWSVRVLRYSGRLQLIKSVLQGIQGYWSMYLFLPKGVLKQIQSVLAKFLWGGDLLTKCHYNVDCCDKKDEGGLGVRDLCDWNRAAILFQTWRIAHYNPTSIWILWVHSCLLKQKSFWTSKIPYKCPWNLRHIFNARPLALRFLSYSVHENSCFKAWHDPWLISSPLIEKFGLDFPTMMDSDVNASVGSLILNGQWHVSTSNDYRAIHFRNLLSSCIIGQKDVVYWNGECSVKISRVWESIRRRGSPKPWLPLLWHRFHIPSCSFISWLACRGRLLTKDRMAYYHLEADPRCVLCSSYDEIAEHLFTICPYSYIILRGCPFDLKINWDSWMLGDFFSDQLSAIQQHMGLLYITVAIYLIWRERNSRIHGKGSMGVSHLEHIVKKMMREKLFTCISFRRELTRDPTLCNLLY